MKKKYTPSMSKSFRYCYEGETFLSDKEEGNVTHPKIMTELRILYHFHYDVLKVLIKSFPMYQTRTERVLSKEELGSTLYTKHFW